MRSLAKPNKTKKIEKQSQRKQQDKKPQSKKITKTTFLSPFHSNIQSLSHEDLDILREDFLPYLKNLRKSMIVRQNPNIHRKFISFEKKQNKLQTLSSNQIVVGVKSIIKEIKNRNHSLHLIVVFYQENRYQLLEELFCRALNMKIPILIARSIPAIQDQMALKTLTCIGLKNQQISHKLSILTTRCSIQIPWLVNKDWVPLKFDQ